MAYVWLVVGQSVVTGLAYGLWAVRSLSATWTAPLQLRYAACGAIQVSPMGQSTRQTQPSIPPGLVCE